MSTYFYVWTPTTEANKFLFVDVAKDPKLCRKMLEKFRRSFMKSILLELLSCKNDAISENNEQYYRCCRRPSFLPLTVCTHRDCKWEWFHYSCLEVKKHQRENSSVKIVKCSKFIAFRKRNIKTNI